MLSLLGFARQIIEVGQRAVHGINVFVIGNVVTEIDLGRRKARRNPDRIHAEIFQVIELGCNAVQIADAVIIAIGETSGVDFVENGVLPPSILCFFRRVGGFLRVSSQPKNAEHKQKDCHRSSTFLHKERLH